MDVKFSKRVRSLLRQLASTAYERELRALLQGLEKSFDRWRQGELGTWDLIEEIDRFTRGHERRRLDHRYNATGIAHMVVAQAIVRGLLKGDEVPADVRTALRPPNSTSF
jgi:hypothetical protein